MIECTAWDLLGDYYEMLDTTHLARVKGGRTLYEGASITSNDKVRVSRLELGDSNSWKIRQINRYLEPDTKMELIPIEETKR